MSSKWLPHGTNLKLPAAVDRAQAAMFGAHKVERVKPDISSSLAWDPGLLTIDALRELGVKATAEKIHAYIAGQKHWAGINGVYNFVEKPQRGPDVSDSVVTRWQRDEQTWTIVSHLGGAPL